MPLSDWLNPWRSPYDSQVPDEVQRPARSNAYFSLAAALSSSPDLIGNLSRGMIQGQQAYQGGISGYMEQRAAEEERKRKEAYLELQQRQMEQNVQEQQAAAEQRRQAEIERQNAIQQAREKRARLERLVQEKAIDPRVLDLPEDVVETVLTEKFTTPKKEETKQVTMADGRLGYIDPSNPTQIIPFGGTNPIRPHYGSGGVGGDGYVDKVVTGGGEVVFVDPRSHTVTPGYKFKDFGADPESLEIQRMNFQRQTAKDLYEQWFEGLDYGVRRQLSDKQKSDKYWEIFGEVGKRTARPSSGVPPPPPPPPAPGQSRSPVINRYRERSSSVGASAKIGAGGKNVAGVQVPVRPSAIPTGQGGARVTTAAPGGNQPPLDQGLVADTAQTLRDEGEVATRALLKANGYSDAEINRYIAAAKGGGR